MQIAWDRMGRIWLFHLLFQNGGSQSSRFPTAGQGEPGSGNEIGQLCKPGCKPETHQWMVLRKTSKCGRIISDTLGNGLVCHVFVLTAFWLHLWLITGQTHTEQHGMYLLSKIWSTSCKIVLPVIRKRMDEQSKRSETHSPYFGVVKSIGARRYLSG